jgi:hypothetical protein
LALQDALNDDQEVGDAPMLTGLSAVNSDPRLLVSEKAGTRSFHIWGKLLLTIGKPGQMRRRPFLALYVVFLVTMILTIVPLSLLVQTLARPLLRDRIGKLKQKFDAPSGSGTERLNRYQH